MNSGPFAVPPVPVTDAPYEYQAWPAWWFGPNGQRQIFKSPDEVPDGWVDSAVEAEAKVWEAGEGEGEPERVLTADQTVSALDDLVNNNSQGELVAMLTAMAEVDDAIEFSASWPKLKLAQCIIDNGGPLEAAAEE